MPRYQSWLYEWSYPGRYSGIPRVCNPECIDYTKYMPYEKRARVFLELYTAFFLGGCH